MEVYEYVPIIAEVFAGVTIIPALALSIASFVHLNKGHDPVRSGFKWLSVSSLCLFL
ncbi:uncharacterized protein B0I36DRAFT_48876 [Microdochium trichocladiopsis]|uniref:Uncharacterized protein n=1 Tax=Microdochium trichocladiopsis TaxID=1682393 RepID=A0A9P8XS70_9PEZI|nr:uncharacterized protein B0I36DRAFT_48876 [Microdochium trichocladiopsis]KAH7014245.1 hypothetical protein B0I36DRAFT_48876 [Microdochium trichocladiopsis]